MEIPRHWRLKAQRYRLEGSACLVCGQVSFPPRPICPHCTVKAEQLAGGEFPVMPASNRTLAPVSSKGG